MIPQRKFGAYDGEDDVSYRIEACRQRLRERRAAKHQSQTGVSSPDKAESPAPNYAEILATVSMNQSSLAKLVECLLEPASSNEAVPEKPEEREEALIT